MKTANHASANNRPPKEKGPKRRRVWRRSYKFLKTNTYREIEASNWRMDAFISETVHILFPKIVIRFYSKSNTQITREMPVS